MSRKMVLACCLLAACGKGAEDSAPHGHDSGTHHTTVTSADYAFESRFGTGSSVSHTGQTARQVLIHDLKTHLGGMTARIDGGSWFPVAGDATAELDFYFAFDGTSAGSVDHLMDTTPATSQATYGEISTSANLVGKLAGNDATGQHQDWSTDFVGWTAPGVDTPESLVRHWFAQIDAAAVDRGNGIVPTGGDGLPVGSVALTAEGQDLQQLLEKFLHGAVAFSQGADDYLDDDLPEKGLNADNTAAEEGELYTALEHAWDEGFAYFGASHFYGSWTDALIADPGYADENGDGTVDLGSELCFGASTNAAKRDAGAVVATDFSQDAWAGFHGGRALIAHSSGALSDAEMTELKAHRDQAIAAWEKALAATVVHYINEVLVDMDTFDAGYDFAGHAKHWSEMKGFALAFQFNPRSPLSDSDFATLHTQLRQAPVLPADGDDAAVAYKADLLAARALIGAAYDFDAANLGGDDGTGGW